MIHPNYSKAILNALFHTKSGDTTAAYSEKSELMADTETEKGLPWIDRTYTDYGAAYVSDGWKTTGETTSKYNKEKARINASQYWYTVDDEGTYGFIDKQNNFVEQSFTGWKIEQRKTPNLNYPTSSYLGLFTTMPNENGLGYVEPVIDSEGNMTTYMRVNLLSSILTGSKSMDTAVWDDETATGSISNKELIIYPEVYGFDWGTIVGVGIFLDKKPGEGSPVFWGRISPEVSATTGHVPLFRIGDLKVTIN